MWSYFWKLLFGGPQENTTSTSPTSSSTASQSSAEPITIKLERDDQGSDVREATSPGIENSQIAPASKTSPELRSKFRDSSSVSTAGVNSAEIESESTAKVERKDNTTDKAVAEQPDWQAHFQEIELARKDGYLDKAEEMFENAISNKAPVDLYSEGLFKIWRLQNKNDLKSEKFELVQKRVLKMLDIHAPGVKITDARSLHKAADLLDNEEIKDRALKAIKVIESSK
ncbi:MAG: hypothetical protein VXW29_18670 [SAR324 cluster bacterium]|nr:hypothetical protein [SAR324 cluster bacterium]